MLFGNFLPSGQSPRGLRAAAGGAKKAGAALQKLPGVAEALLRLFKKVRIGGSPAFSAGATPRPGKPRKPWPDGRKFPKDREVKKRVQRKSTFKNCGIFKKVGFKKMRASKLRAPNFKNSGFKNPNFKNRGRENRCKKAKLSAEIAVFLLKFQRKNPRRKHEKNFLRGRMIAYFKAFFRLLSCSRSSVGSLSPNFL